MYTMKVSNLLFIIVSFDDYCYTKYKIKQNNSHENLGQAENDERSYDYIGLYLSECALFFLENSV